MSPEPSWEWLTTRQRLSENPYYAAIIVVNDISHAMSQEAHRHLTHGMMVD
jgi:uncharacterized membrane protein YiaA